MPAPLPIRVRLARSHRLPSTGIGRRTATETCGASDSKTGPGDTPGRAPKAPCQIAIVGLMLRNRERMAKLEGALEGFLAGRRDRDPVCFHKKSAAET